MGQAQGLCCNDNSMQDKRRGEVHLYNRDHPKDATDETVGNPEELDCNSAEEHNFINDRLDLTMKKSKQKRRGSFRGAKDSSATRPLARPLDLLSSDRKIPFEARLSSQDRMSAADDVG